MQRRNFIKNVGTVSTGFILLPTGNLFALNSPADVKIKLAIIGTGLRGQDHLELLLRRDDVDVVAICDVSDRMLKDAKALVIKFNKKMPEVFTGDNYSYKKLLEKYKNIDGIVIATPWEWHKPMIVDSINAGIKYVASEVIIGISLQDHWDVVHAAEKNNAHVMMLENVCYRRDVMAVLNMVRQNLFLH